MNKCLICGAPHDRQRYCSTKCSKRAWYTKNSLGKKSLFNNNPLFWKTETGVGYKWELWAAKKLGATHLPFNNSGCDLDLNGIKIDVKVCNLFKIKLRRGKPTNNPGGQWVFNRGKKKPCDFFFCICLEGEKVIKLLYIPDKYFPNIGTSIGKISRYDKFII